MGCSSLREKTHAHRNYVDDVPAEVKQRRLAEVIATFQRIATAKNAALVGTVQVVLVEGSSRRAPDQDLGGRAESNLRVFFPADAVPSLDGATAPRVPTKGDYVLVEVTRTTSQSLRGRALACSTALRPALAAATAAPRPALAAA